MKLHLPTSLRGALIACMSMACTAYAADYTAYATSGNNGIKAKIGTDASTETALGNIAAGNKIIFNLSSGYMGKTADDTTIVADVEIAGWTINNGFSTMAYTFSGTVTGTGDFNFTHNTVKEQSYTFTGDVSGYTGTIDFNKKGDKNHTFTFTNSGTEAKTLNAAAVKVGGTIVFNGTGAYTSNSVLTANDVDVNTNVTFTKGVTATTSFDITSGNTATFTDAALNLSGATINNAGTLVLSGTSTLQLSNAGGSYNVGTLDLDGRDINSVITGLSERYDASYSGTTLKVYSLYNLTWNAAADGTTWTSDNAWLYNGATEGFQASDNVTFGADAASKKVGITGNITAGTITIEDDYEFNVTAASTITGTFNMAEGTTLTKTGDAALTIGTSTRDHSFETLVVAEGSLTINNATIDTLSTLSGTSTTLNNTGIKISTLEVGGVVTINQAAAYNDITNVVVNDGGELVLGNADCDLNATSITLNGGAKLTSHCKWGLGANSSILNLNAEDKAAVIAGNYYGNLSIGNTQGKGTLEIQQCHNGHGNSVIMGGTVSDNGGALTIKVTSGKLQMHSTTTYSGGTMVEGGELDVTHDDALGTGDVVVNGGTFVVGGTARTLDNTIKAGATDATVFTMGATDATYQNVVMTKDGITTTTYTVQVPNTDGTEGTHAEERLNTAEINGANISVTGAYALSNAKLTDVAITAVEGAALTNTNVTLDGVNTFTLGGESITLTNGLISTNVLSGMTLTGSITVDFSSELLAYVESNLGTGNTLTISLGNLTLPEATGYSLLNEPIQVSDTLVSVFGEATLSKTDGNVSIVFDGTGSANIPEPTTATLSLLALAGLAARRRRK